MAVNTIDKLQFLSFMCIIAKLKAVGLVSYSCIRALSPVWRPLSWSDTLQVRTCISILAPNTYQRDNVTGASTY